MGPFIPQTRFSRRFLSGDIHPLPKKSAATRFSCHPFLSGDTHSLPARSAATRFSCEINTHCSLETPTLYLQDLPPSLFFSSWHLSIVIRCFGACFLSWAHQLPLSLMRSPSTPFMIISSYPFLSWVHQLPFSRWYFHLWDHQLPLSLRSSTTIFFMRPSAIPFIHEIINYPFSLMRSPTTLSPLVLSLMRSANFHLDQLPFFSHEIISYPFLLMGSSTTPFLSRAHQLPYPRWYFHLWNHQLPLFLRRSSATVFFSSWDHQLSHLLMRSSSTPFLKRDHQVRTPFTHGVIGYPLLLYDHRLLALVFPMTICYVFLFTLQ